MGVKTDVTKGSQETQEKQTATTEIKANGVPAESAKGTVNVSSNPTGADVAVDGEFVGNTPSVLKVSPGKHTVTVKLQGFKDWSREISVQAGSDVQLTATLEKMN